MRRYLLTILLALTCTREPVMLLTDTPEQISNTHTSAESQQTAPPETESEQKAPPEEELPSRLRVGFAERSITPTLVDTWVDANGDKRFRESDGDTFQDGNGNGRFDAFWLAGFDQARPAQGVNDEIEAVAIVIEKGAQRIAIVAIDAIGFLWDDVEAIRQALPAELGINHIFISSTHCHEVPDLLGMWGPNLYTSGINSDYRALVRVRIVEAVGAAASNLTPTNLFLHEMAIADSMYVEDTRKPEVLDPGIRQLLFRAIDDNRVLGSVVTWANHPEVLWRDNLLITADYVGYVRRGLKDGLIYDDKVVQAGLGGIHLYINGAIGGLLTTGSTQTIRDLHENKDYREPSFAKARAVGYAVAKTILDGIPAQGIPEKMTDLTVKTRLVDIPVANLKFLAAAHAGIIPRTIIGLSTLRTEVSLITLGEAWIATIPGEIYPEIVNGGVEKPAEGDHSADAIAEIPPLRSLMRGRLNMVFGLTNDEIGYIIPKTQWDEKAPFTYGLSQAPYGEGNSPGPEAGPRIHKAIVELIESL